MELLIALAVGLGILYWVWLRSKRKSEKNTDYALEYKIETPSEPVEAEIVQPVVVEAAVAEPDQSKKKTAKKTRAKKSKKSSSKNQTI